MRALGEVRILFCDAAIERDGVQRTIAEEMQEETREQVSSG
jgi:hypothetical protein